jgi:hypothetical protein
MLELMIKMNPHFTQEDRNDCEPVIARILELAALARLEGIFALEDAVQNEPDSFLKESVMAVMDGNEQEQLRKLMSYMILSSNAQGSELLGKFIIAEGTLQIQDGTPPRVLQTILGAMLGGDYLARKRAEEEAKHDYVPTLDEFYDMIKHRSTEATELEGQIIALPDESIRASLVKLDARDFAVAFRDLSAEAIRKLMDNITEDKQREIIADWKKLGPVRVVDVDYAIKTICGTLGIAQEE